MKPINFVSRNLLNPLCVFCLCFSLGLQAQETLEAILQRVPKAPPGVPVPPLPAGPLCCMCSPMKMTAQYCR